MRFLKRKMGLGLDNADEDDGLHWNVLGCNLAVLGCTGLHWTVVDCTGLYWAVLGCTRLH